MSDTMFSLRLREAESDLEFGAAVEGVTRSEFVRRAVRERAARIEEESTRSTEEEVRDERRGS